MRGFVRPEDNSNMAAPSNDLGNSSFRFPGSGKSGFRALAHVALAASIAAVLSACGPNGNTGAGGGPKGGTGGEGGTGGDGGTGGTSGPCPENATRDCHVTLGQHGNVLSCFDGMQSCKDGVWGPCEGEQSDKPMPAPPVPGAAADQARNAPSGQKVLSLSSAASCVTNPCDPTCQVFVEVPPTPVGSPPQNLIAPWKTGNYADLDPKLQGVGTSEPCDQGNKCQFDQYCSNPSSGTCAHHVCVTGTGLSAGCEGSGASGATCVQKICASDSSCCTTPVPASGSCAHDLCVTGAALDKVTPCDPCVTTVCSLQYQHCCDTVNGAWTAECVARVTSACGKTCATGSWTQSCVDKVDSLCDAKCLTDNTPPQTCTHDKCYLGPALVSGCDPCVTTVCAQAATAACCTTAWDGSCLDAVAALCPADTCPPKGDCVPWLPSQVNPSCNVWDLTVGVGCTNAGKPTVPVCNHGKSTAPANLSLYVMPPALPNVIQAYAPNVSAATLVNIGSSIAPGKCVNVTLPVAIAEGSQILVNTDLVNTPSVPAGGHYDNSECHGDNNGGVWSASTGLCAEPSCAGASAFSKLKKPRLFFSVDMSKSQTDFTVSGAGSASASAADPLRWSAVVGALTAFIQDPASDAVAMWMRYWPYRAAAENYVGSPYGCPGPSQVFSAGCGSVPGCSTPNAQVDDLASAANENALLTVLNALVPGGNTPMFPALDGAIYAAEQNLITHPDEIPVVILVTDGNPTQCAAAASPAPAGINNVAAVAGTGFNGYGVRTYVIGIEDKGAANATLATNAKLVAGAGGGKAFFIGQGAGGMVQSQIINALNSIKNDFVSCTLPLPNQNLFDPQKAAVTFTPGAGAATTLPQVANAAGCAGGDGWYYDDPANPKTITLCTSTCNTVKLDTNGKLDLKINCIKQFLPSTYTQKYTASCGFGKVPQWGFFAYDTTTPGDSKIDIRFHTSDDDVTYSALPAMANVTIQNANQVCPMGGPMPCPIDIFTALGGLPKAQQQYLELVADVYPTSDKNMTPKINNWQVTYSCPDSE